MNETSGGGSGSERTGAEIAASVLDFYKELPFNYRQSAARHAKGIRKNDMVRTYPGMAELFQQPGTRVLEVGCGVGGFANSVAHYYGCEVTAIDSNPVATERAVEVARELSLDVTFQVADLFEYAPGRTFDVVVSLGVLHHTKDCAGAVRRVCRDFVGPGGHALIGLYHSYGRQPFLRHFENMKSKGTSEDEMLALFSAMESRITDKTHMLSWFRDQVLHPHETQHTLEEMIPLIEDCGMSLVSTSINRFQKFSSLDALYAEEKTYQARAEAYLEDGKYFPGFFLFLVRKE